MSAVRHPPKYGYLGTTFKETRLPRRGFFFAKARTMSPGASWSMIGFFRSLNRWKAANIGVIRLKLGASGRIGVSVFIAHVPTYRSCRNQLCTL